MAQPPHPNYLHKRASVVRTDLEKSLRLAEGSSELYGKLLFSYEDEELGQVRLHEAAKLVTSPSQYQKLTVLASCEAASGRVLRVSPAVSSLLERGDGDARALVRKMLRGSVVVRTDLEKSLRFAEKNGYLSARARIWELEEMVADCHTPTDGRYPECPCQACANVRSRRAPTEDYR